MVNEDLPPIVLRKKTPGAFAPGLWLRQNVRFAFTQRLRPGSFTRVVVTRPVMAEPARLRCSAEVLSNRLSTPAVMSASFDGRKPALIEYTVKPGVAPRSWPTMLP